VAVLREILSNRNLGLMAATVGLVHLALHIYQPWWSLYLMELGASIELVGLLEVLRRSLVLACQLPGGLLTDRLGRKKMILFGTSLRSLTFLIFMLAQTWQHLILGLITYDLAMLGSPAVTLLALESLHPKRRAAGMSVVTMMNLLAATTAMPLSGFVMDAYGIVNGMRLILATDAILFLTVLIARLKLRETLVPRKTERVRLGLKEVASSFRLERGELALLLTETLIMAGMSTSRAYLVVYGTKVIGLTRTQWGLLEMASYLSWAALSLPGGMFADRFGRRPAILIAMIGFPLTILNYVLLRDFGAILVANVVAGSLLGLGGGRPPQGSAAWQALIADMVPTERMGRVLGVLRTVSGLITTPFPYIGGYLWVALRPDAAMLTSVALMSTAMLPFYTLVKPTRERRSA